ncbi:uncharacterized protein METZ01_LOCUS19485 [marine metagenome]|uniref:Uncharacterized protein n=1 Tax=marine metagenome TaxID=408172 RepID=A0A381PHX7_9ZZZZ
MELLIVYSPLPHANSKNIGLLFLKILFQLPFNLSYINFPSSIM